MALITEESANHKTIVTIDGPAPGITRYSETILPTEFGDFQCIIYRRENGDEEVAMVVGDVSGKSDVFCRIHSSCLTSEVLNSIKCDCKKQLDAALQKIQSLGCGIVVYLHQEGRGIGLGDKIRAYAEQAKGRDTVDANRVLGLPDDARTYAGAAYILKDIGVTSVSLLTNNPLKIKGLEKNGVVVSRRIPHLLEAGEIANNYVRVKQDRMGHLGSKI